MIPGLILVRTRSTRLPEKCLLQFGEKKVIEHIADRAKHFGFRPIICTTNHNADDNIVKIVHSNKWECFRGSEEDKIKRLRDACNEFGIEKFVTIDADDPFFDASLDKKIYNGLKKYDFVEPPTDYYCGSAGFGVKKHVLDKATDQFNTSKSEMMWNLIEKLPKIEIKYERKPMDMPRVRLSLDYMEDYYMLLTILRIVGPYATPEQIKKVLKNNPDMHKINWFREEQWRKKQDDAK